MGKNKFRKGLTLQFMPFAEISGMDSAGRIKKLLRVILDNKLIVLQGRLRLEEETRLIEDTMVMIDNIKGFKGVELAVITSDVQTQTFFNKFKNGLANMLTGQQNALTIIGPATIVKEMKRDPSKLEVMMR